ncbi:hypothetical protein D3C85_1058410 [compost metagenome]
MAAKSMMAVGGLVVCPLARDQLSCFSQDSEQAIAPHPQPRPCFGMQHIMQLACSQPWLAPPLFQDEIHDLLIVASLRIKRSVALVVSLT